ncbi:MAG: AmmeMemoRadiSam system protein B, partial [Candidatus Aenigmarchaeota archaeon]|nr:AmmeMemoRadiSam system protein B [Candidatus Aenigmarchaeota archaeon]
STETDNSAPHITRNPVVAGTFYPASKTDLENTINTYYENVKDNTPTGVRAIIAPHAGYVYSGQTAAFAYKSIQGKETILLLAPSHHIYFHGASIANATHYKTPLGEIKLSEKTGSIKEDLDKAGLLYTGKDAHEKEHAIEVQLPFLQKTLQDFKIIPILIGGATDYKSQVKIAEILSRHTDKSTLIIASSDFTHYGARYSYTPFTENKEENIRNLDYGAIGHIEKKDSESFHNYIQRTGATICGSKPITILLEMIQEGEPDLKGKLLHYDASGRITGDYTNSVSYVSYVFYKEDALNKEEQEYLTTLARDTLESYLKDGKKPEIDENTLPSKITEKKGCFVTLKKDGHLRGCIGHIFAQKPVYQCVIDNSVSAAVHDSRFSPVAYSEREDIHIEVSVLSVPKALEFKSPEELLDKLTPLEDGVVI